LNGVFDVNEGDISGGIVAWNGLWLNNTVYNYIWRQYYISISNPTQNYESSFKYMYTKFPVSLRYKTIHRNW
jgi:hypothetical protein